jgi:hypothetical protein
VHTDALGNFIVQLQVPKLTTETYTIEDATYAAYQSLAATVTVKPIDFSWTYALAEIAIGLVALIAGLLVTVYYFLYKRRPATTTATASTPTEAPK